jgi:uncharacterized protein
MAGGLAVTKEPGTDLSVEPSVRAVRPAPHGELVRMRGGHHEPFLDGHEASEAELSFLCRHLLDRASMDRTAPVASAPHRGGQV